MITYTFVTEYTNKIIIIDAEDLSEAYSKLYFEYGVNPSNCELTF